MALTRDVRFHRPRAATYPNQNGADIQELSPSRPRILELGTVPSGQNEGSPVSPTQRQVPLVPGIPSNSVSRLPRSNDGQERIDVPGNLTQGTVPLDQATQPTNQSPSVIDNAHPLSQGNNDEQITEVPREAELVMVCALY